MPETIQRFLIFLVYSLIVKGLEAPAHLSSVLKGMLVFLARCSPLVVLVWIMPHLFTPNIDGYRVEVVPKL